MSSLIRTATTADIPATIDLIEALTVAVDGPQEVCRIKTGETLAGLIASPDSVVFRSEHGFIAGCIMRTVISPAPVAAELGWYATDRSGLRLLAAFEGWSAEKGATLIKMTCAGGAVQNLLARRGYRVAEIQMVR